MDITVNGTTKHLDGATTLAALLDALDLPPGKVAAEINREIVPKSRHADTALKDGDAVEIIHFIGGG